MRKFLNKSACIAALVFVFLIVISCEKDFTDIGSNIISNTKFDTDTLLVDLTIENSPVASVISDNITVEPGTYLLGVYASDTYQNIEASIVSQLAISTDLKVIDDANVYGTDTIVETTIDTVFLKLPYQVTLNDDATAYELDSIIGDTSKAFYLNLYETSIYLNSLNPEDPSKLNSYTSNDVFEKEGSELNSSVDFEIKPSASNTQIVINRRLNDGVTVYAKDTITYTTSTTSTVPLPFAMIPLKEDAFKSKFLDQYESSNFDSQDAFNNYFRGIILEASGEEGSLLSLKFNSTVNPSVEVYYTNTVLTGGQVIDTIKKNDSFLLSGVRASTYKMEEKTYPEDKIILQGTAGNEALIKLFGKGDTNGLTDQINELRDQNLLINDASLTVYVDQSADNTIAPYQLYLYKSDEEETPKYSEVKDVYSEGTTLFGGLLEEDSDGTAEKYTFRITDYISDILNGETDYSPALRLKVINSTDLQVIADTTYTNYSWNPKAVTLLNHSTANGVKKAKLRIAYSKKKE